MDFTTIKISKRIARKLSSLQKSVGAKSLDETVDLLVRQHRKELIRHAFGADHGRVKPFSEEDRGEDNS